MLKDQDYDRRHGGAYDRGSADAYYGREFNPHYFKGASYDSEKVGRDGMDEYDIAAYTAGFNQTIDRKDF